MASRLKTPLENPQRLDCLVYTGLFYIRQKNYKEASIHFEECKRSLIKIGPTRYEMKSFINLLLKHAECYFMINEYNRAIAECDDCLSLNLNDYSKIAILDIKGINFFQHFSNLMFPNFFTDSFKYYPCITLISLKRNCLLPIN